eukprot:gnl/TRDRNA2_/TRDRNA2_174833_c0_seq1.p1 gnl/TRDRNA2_/TRDRNA2_174833_c0~~gnl/TRDRNA2_/TRDRNA2_174833_c0_seq1.p1  ORF type:complete len:273 (+),score=41.75 gnl/TRDRNA2_/TRDRNA2_174833_c0_seq1:112-819(+)
MAGMVGMAGMVSTGAPKTMMCRFWQTTGTCASGSQCTFAHSPAELAPGSMVQPALPAAPVAPAVDPSSIKGYKMKLCQFFEQTGACGRGATCTYAHGAHELRNRDGTLVSETATAGIPASALAAMQQMAMMGRGGLDPMAAQAQNYMAALLPAEDTSNPRPGEVRMSTPEEANRCVKQMNGFLLKGWPMEVRHDPTSQDGTKVIVENLAPDVKWQDLKDCFGKIGKVKFTERPPP